MKNLERKLYDVACDVINIVEKINYSQDGMDMAYKNAKKIIKELDKKEKK
jgi:hypothetical protein